MTDDLFPKATPAVTKRRKELTPGATDDFENFSKAVFAEGALDEQTKQLIAVAVAHVTQCPYCIEGHSTLAKRKGASAEQVMEAIWGGRRDTGWRRLRALHHRSERDW